MFINRSLWLKCLTKLLLFLPKWLLLPCGQLRTNVYQCFSEIMSMRSFNRFTHARSFQQRSERRGERHQRGCMGFAFPLWRSFTCLASAGSCQSPRGQLWSGGGVWGVIFLKICMVKMPQNWPLISHLQSWGDIKDFSLTQTHITNTHTHHALPWGLELHRCPATDDTSLWNGC